MKSILSGALALLIVTQPGPAACAPAQAAAPFPVIPVSEPAHGSHLGAYLCIGLGVAASASSFVISHDADRTYDEYLNETDPARIDPLYDRTLSLDRWSRTTLLGGQALIVTGLYLRFIRHAPESRTSLIVTPTRCALALRF